MAGWTVSLEMTATSMMMKNTQSHKKWSKDLIGSDKGETEKVWNQYILWDNMVPDIILRLIIFDSKQKK